MYADASLHRENGAWQMIFGVNTIPACRRQGYAGQLLQRVPHSHVGGHFHLVAADPRGQAALGQSVHLAIVTVDLVAQQGDGHGNVLRLFIQHGDDDLYLSRAVLERHRLLAVLAAVMTLTGNLE